MNGDTATKEENDGRLENEISLLQAMYPNDEIAYDGTTRELKFNTTTTAGAGSLTLRIPAGYPSSPTAKPSIVTATAASSPSRDVTTALKAHLSAQESDSQLPDGEEHLDAILAAFLALLTSPTPPQQHASAPPSSAAKTVLVHTHHLLAPSKRKAALAPADPHVAGLSKPGHPGILLFSGPAESVDAHVEELKGLRWQSWQVRLDVGEGWEFGHGEGVREVEGISEVVEEIVEGVVGVGEGKGKGRRGVVLGALGVRMSG